MSPIRLRVTIVVEYEPDPEHYGTDDPAAMAHIDQDNWNSDPLRLFSSFDDDEFKVTVEPITDPA